MNQQQKHDMQVRLNQAAQIAAAEMSTSGILDEFDDLCALVVVASRMLDRYLQR